MSNKIDCRNLLVSAKYADGYPHHIWEQIRKNDPVHWVDDWDGPPYWAITRHEDIIKISKNPEVFKNAPRGIMQEGGGDSMQDVRTLLTMDPPEHREYRALVSRKFTPKSMTRIYDNVDQMTEEVLRRAASDGKPREIELVENISARIPIWVIAEMLGVAKEDWEDVFHMTNMLVGASDPDFRKGRSEEDVRNEGNALIFGFFGKLSHERRENPKDDLISDLVHAKVNGKPMEDLELMSYYLTLMAAGNETTRNAITGGIMALMDNPDQFQKLKAQPEMLDSFIEELLRFVSPVIHFCRTPAVDVELGGKQIKAGDPMVLFFPSANRDETVFEDPHRFNMERTPNPHLAFGIGEHFCLGTHVARLELRAVFRQLTKYLKYIEPLEKPDLLANAIVGGVKRFNVRYELDFSSAT